MVDGQCIIGMRRLAMIPLIGFDLLVNVRHSDIAWHWHPLLELWV